MKTALITTTIYEPKVLKLYRRCDRQMAIFIAGDQKTPHERVRRLCREIEPAHYYGPEQQSEWNISELLGWNCIQRRNIALLEALKWGADLIISVDDDNFPLNFDYFDDFKSPLLWESNGIGYTGEWFDPGQLLIPPVPQRGFPHTELSGMYYDVVFDKKVGVAQGIVIGDPDCSAVDRISRSPVCYGVSELARAGLVVDPAVSWTVFNSQNTAFIRAMAPCFFMWPYVGRYDDIYASLVAQRVMRELNLCTHYGQPLVWQQRTPQDTVKNLEGEVEGMGSVVEMTAALDDTELAGSVLDMWSKCVIATADFMPKWGHKIFEMWHKDVRSVL